MFYDSEPASSHVDSSRQRFPLKRNIFWIRPGLEAGVDAISFVRMPPHQAEKSLKPRPKHVSNWNCHLTVDPLLFQLCTATTECVCIHVTLPPDHPGATDGLEPEDYYFTFQTVAPGLRMARPSGTSTVIVVAST